MGFETMRMVEIARKFKENRTRAESCSLVRSQGAEKKPAEGAGKEGQ